MAPHIGEEIFAVDRGFQAQFVLAGNQLLMSMSTTSKFKIDEIHLNRRGYYKIVAKNGSKVRCQYVDDGEFFDGTVDQLALIERKCLGFNLLTYEQAHQVCVRLGLLDRLAGDIEVIRIGSARLHKEDSERVEEADRKRVQELYHKQMRLIGTPLRDIVRPTRGSRETGCHKCRRGPLISQNLYQCQLCGGMICGRCGSCLCNRE